MTQYGNSSNTRRAVGSLNQPAALRGAEGLREAPVTLPTEEPQKAPVTGKAPASRIRRTACGLAAFLLCLFCLSCLSGCRINGDDQNTVSVFYLTAEKNALSPKKCQLRTESDHAQAEELLDLLADQPADESLIPPVSGFHRTDFSLEKNTILIEFSSEYREMDTITEKLTRAAVVTTLCELKNIRRVTIRVNGALIIDEKGNKSENMTADQFIYNSGSEMLNYENTTLHLYFASEDGTKLVETFRPSVYNSNIPLERIVVEQVIAGPNNTFSSPSVNENTRVVNILTRDNICTVTLDRTFLTNPYEVSPEVAIYSIVNSLTELPAIRQVQILIDGVDKPLYMNTYPLDTETLLQKNEKIIQTRE